VKLIPIRGRDSPLLAPILPLTFHPPPPSLVSPFSHLVFTRQFHRPHNFQVLPSLLTFDPFFFLEIAGQPPSLHPQSSERALLFCKFAPASLSSDFLEDSPSCVEVFECPIVFLRYTEPTQSVFSGNRVLRFPSFSGICLNVDTVHPV